MEDILEKTRKEILKIRQSKKPLMSSLYFWREGEIVSSVSFEIGEALTTKNQIRAYLREAIVHKIQKHMIDDVSSCINRGETV